MTVLLTRRPGFISHSMCVTALAGVTGSYLDIDCCGLSTWAVVVSRPVVCSACRILQRPRPEKLCVMSEEGEIDGEKPWILIELSA